MRDRIVAARAVCRRWLALYMPVAGLVLAASALAGFALGSLVPLDALPTTDGGGSNPFFPDRLTTYTLTVNNLVAAFVMLLGAVSIGTVTLFGLVLNGLLLGGVVGVVAQELPLVVVLALIAPHGIIELPALLVVAAIGLRFARLTVRYLRGLEAELVTRRDLREAGWLAAVAAVMIVVAAYIEANFTIAVAEWVAGGELSGVEP